jgi:hypothetical protein
VAPFETRRPRAKGAWHQFKIEKLGKHCVLVNIGRIENSNKMLLQCYSPIPAGRDLNGAWHHSAASVAPFETRRPRAKGAWHQFKIEKFGKHCVLVNIGRIENSNKMLLQCYSPILPAGT